MKTNEQKIYDLVVKDQLGRIDYLRGKNYHKGFIQLKDIYETDSTRCAKFQVESESDYSFYEVEIRMRKGEIIGTRCTCPRYYARSMCKHIAASLLNYQDDIFYINSEEKILYDSLAILKEFYEEPKKNKIKLKKALNLTIEIRPLYNPYYNTTDMGLKCKIGDEKLYSLNNKFTNFMKVYDSGNGVVEFGKNFKYSNEEYYFTETDKKIIKYFHALYKNNPYYNYRDLQLSDEMFRDFIETLENKTFTIENFGLINKISHTSPLNFKLSKENEYYYLKPLDKSINFLSPDFSYAVDDNTLYIIPQKVSRILGLMKQTKLEKLKFKENDLELFTNGLLGIVRETVKLDETTEGQITIGVKPKIGIYLDLKGNLVICNLKLTYKSKEIDYFDESVDIIRDDTEEELLINSLLNEGFKIENKKIYIDELDTIGEFLENGLLKLAETYEVFTSNKLKETNIIKENNIKSKFSIGQDNILKYEFDLGNIQNDEIVNVLESLKNKKKYYKLKSGDLINLENTNELKEFESLIDDMNLSYKDLKNGVGEIPKYRAIYLDSIKEEKYNIITTNNLFDELIKNFKSYKDKNVKFSKQDEKILRDYQITGVKWLYNIHKCGFGGILADEMGLGKSIQLIYFIKEILKEQKDAKILIVAPTSLIYNWKNEFDKFGSELKYKVFAENKIRRKEELEHLKDTNILITTYGLIRQDHEVYEKMNFELIAIDEAQNIKNSNAMMTKVIKNLHGSTKLALTGTPLENSVLELWSIFDFIMPGYLASLQSFSHKYNVKDVSKEDLKILTDLNKQIKPFILRRKKKDVVKELPDKIENNIFIELSKEQKKVYVAELEKTKKEMDEIIASEGFKKANFKILQLLGRLRQLCIDPKIIYEDYEGGSSKIEQLISLTEEIIKNGHKILLFTSYKTALDIVNREFTNQGISTYVIDGSVPSKKRMELVNKFNKDDTNVFLITLKSGGTGLNLTSADVVIHLDLWWNPQVENQATDRAHRIGQKNTVEVIKLVCKGTIEERILELQNKKKVLSDTLIEGEDRDKNIISKLTEKDIKRLLSIDNED